MVYAWFSLGYLLVLAVLDQFILRTKVTGQPQTWRLLLIMLLLTAIFDNIITGLPIVVYDEAKISGLRLLYAPIEDFGYTVAAVWLVQILKAKLQFDHV